ncbi:MAG: PA2779 family protein [Undibacterium sp.]|uniref:PA2779 family protein n=1 Tax=Undibacterium sp. TaxID=1914977 RepID=UPI0027165916|nr:PA2779 family protein [Undibacterium sp.]MDO8654583.1 PA2779 family protein [Undibacterium sp.]
MNAFKRIVSSLLIVSTAVLGLPLTAQAGIISTDAAMATQLSSSTSANREQVISFLTRADVRTAMQEQGINSDAALQRVQAMSDTEVAQLAGRIDTAPAGGEILGIIFTIFIILLVTDILGLTKVFPFTRSVR